MHLRVSALISPGLTLCSEHYSKWKIGDNTACCPSGNHTLYRAKYTSEKFRSFHFVEQDSNSGLSRRNFFTAAEAPLDKTETLDFNDLGTTVFLSVNGTFY